MYKYLEVGEHAQELLLLIRQWIKYEAPYKPRYSAQIDSRNPQITIKMWDSEITLFFSPLLLAVKLWPATAMETQLDGSFYLRNRIMK